MSSEVGVQSELSIFGFVHDTSLLVFSNSFLEEIGLAVERDVFHEIKGILHTIDLGAFELGEKAISDILNVDSHQLAVHADESDGESFRQKLSLDLDGFADDLSDSFFAGFVHQVLEHETGEVSVKSFVSGDQFVAERESGHKPTLFEPENGSETT